MILCDSCKGNGGAPGQTPFGYRVECGRCHGTGRLTFQDLRHGDHLCLLYKDASLQLSEAVDFLLIGLSRGERLFYAWDDHAEKEVRRAFAQKGVDVERELERGSIEISRAKEIYTFGGEFDPKKVLGFFKGYIDATLRAGFTGLRAAGEMTWALGQSDWTAAIREYETICDDFMRTQKPPVVGLCQYNRSRFQPEIIRAALETHGAAVLV